MFEGFSDGGPTWGCEDEDESLPPPTPPEWWEILVVALGLSGLGLLVFRLSFYGI